MIIVLHVKLNSPQSAILVSIIARMGVWVLDNYCAINPTGLRARVWSVFEKKREVQTVQE